MTDFPSSPSSEVSKSSGEPSVLPNSHTSRGGNTDKIIDLCPGKTGINMVVKVLDTLVIAQRKFSNGTVINVAEVLLADDTASVVLSARNEQIEILKGCNYVKIENGKVEMFENYMRLTVDKWGNISEALEEFTYLPEGSREINVSNIEYKLE